MTTKTPDSQPSRPRPARLQSRAVRTERVARPTASSPRPTTLARTRKGTQARAKARGLRRPGAGKAFAAFGMVASGAAMLSSGVLAAGRIGRGYLRANFMRRAVFAATALAGVSLTGFDHADGYKGAGMMPAAEMTGAYAAQPEVLQTKKLEFASISPVTRGELRDDTLNPFKVASPVQVRLSLPFDTVRLDNPRIGDVALSYAPTPGQQDLTSLFEMPTSIYSFPTPVAERERVSPAAACDKAWGDATKFAAMAIVVDAQGRERVTTDVGADVVRHPASMTKMMTLLVAFDEIRAGRLKLTDRVPFSAKANNMPRTNLVSERAHLRLTSLSVEETLLGIGVRSANDGAVAIAEKIAGSEEAFARRMTDRAISLGMMSTNFTNASGLPDPDNVTTARDMITLQRAIAREYAGYVRFLSTTRFTISAKVGKKTRTAVINGHNPLMHGDIDGGWRVDSAKTGFINASGYNMALHGSRTVKGKKEDIWLAILGTRSGTARTACIETIAARM